MTTHSHRRSASRSHRKGSRRAIAAALAALLGGAAGAQAEPVPYRNGQLSIQIADFDPLAVPPSAPLASGVLDATRVGDSLQAIELPAGAFATSFQSIVVDPPYEGVIDGVQLVNVSHASAGFTSTGGGGGFFGGPMPLQGTLRVCTFNLTGIGCQGQPVVLSIPLSVVGAPAIYTADVLFNNLTVQGAAWTTGPVSISANGGTIEVSGGISPIAGPGSDLAVEMVSPIIIRTDLPSFEEIPAWASMRFVVPEPGVLAIGAGAVGTLLLLGLTRRRG